MTKKSEGNCFFCGTVCKRIAMRNHILKTHAEGDEDCYLLLAEGVGDHWMMIDVALDKSLSSIDLFLRKAWLECCGHMSQFGTFENTIGKNRKIGEFFPGDKILHQYDFGTTTYTLFTVLARTTRPKQYAAVRLLARNIPRQYECKNCGKAAAFVCSDCGGMYEDAVFCGKCIKEHEERDEFVLPLTNSPRCGECAYCGEEDVFEFKPRRGPLTSTRRKCMVWTVDPARK